ncbi:MAG: ROK family protein [Microbacterium sp.]
MSRAALSGRLGLSPASLTRLAKPFLDLGYFVEREEPAQGVGRPARPLDVSDDIGRFLGVKVTQNALFAVLTDVRIRPLAEVALPLDDPTPDAVVAGVLDARRRLLEQSGESRPVGIGVSLGGQIESGTVLWAQHLGWENVPLGSLFAQATRTPVVLENDVIALAEAERWFGVGKDVPGTGFAVLTIGAGVGFALVANGRVVREKDAGLGTAMHIPLIPDGAECPLGHRGCAFGVLADRLIAQRASEALGREVSYDEVLHLATEGESHARAIVDEAADALGQLIATAANLSQLPTTVLGGEGIGLFHVAEQRVRDAIARYRDPRATEVPLLIDDSGSAAWSRGAAAVAVQAGFASLRLT